MDSTEKNGAEYTVNFINNSSNTGSIMIFQQDENVGVDGVMSLAWLAKKVHPTTAGSFTWTIDYNFVWAETGHLKSGITFTDSQTPYADLSTSNSIELTYDGAYNFINQTPASPQGSLYIKQDATIPLKQASVGIGMSGAAVFAVQAQPNMSLTFTPHPEYWIAFGNYQKGQVLNLQEMTNCAPIEFPPGIFAMDAILNPDNTWTIQPSEGMI